MARDPATGVVTVSEERCMGCGYCAWVCPYDAPRFDRGQGVMTKCTLCEHRLREGRMPACAEACPTGALGHGDLVGDVHFPGFPDTPARPRIRFAPLRRATPPESTWTLPAEVAAAFAPSVPSEAAPGGRARAAPRLERVVLTLRGEWPLWLFTIGLAALVGWIGAAAPGVAAVLGSPPVRVPRPAFLALAAALLGVATLHLGRPLRAWRALANARGSALGRELGAVGTFLGASALWLAWGGAGVPPLLPGAPPPAPLNALGMTAAFLGLVALAAADRVYLPVRRGDRIHSADTLLTGPLLAAALLRSSWIFGALAAVKLAAAARHAGRRCPDAAALVALRALALAASLALWALAPGAWDGWTPLLIVAVEAADRARFYRELVIPEPGRTVRHEPAG
jgi:DMSO reductase anchor subunit/ferredoxin